MIVLDASVLIALFDEHDAQHSLAADRLVAVTPTRFACSPITLAEVLVGPARAGRLGDARRAVETLGVHEVELPSDASVRLAVLRAETGLKLPDCCVLLAAETTRASLVSFDDRLVREAARRGL